MRTEVLAISIAVVLVVAIVGFGVAAFPSPPARSGSTGESQTATSQAGIPGPTEPTLWHEDCATLNSTGETTCTSSVSREGQVQTFNLTTWPRGSPDDLAFHAQYFAVQTNASTTLQYSVENQANLLVYFSTNSPSSGRSLAEDVAASQDLLLNRSQVGPYAGGLAARSAGLYIFDFPVQAASPVGVEKFVVQDASAVQDGIRIEFGSPSSHEVRLDSTDGAQVSFPGLWEWPVTVYSNTTTNVTFSSTAMNDGCWLAFFPQVLSGVGPEGANATMMLAGGQTVSTTAGSALFVYATGADGGSGEAFFSFRPGSNPLSVLRGPGLLANLSTTAYQGEPSYPILGAVYAPAAGANVQPLPVSLSIAGMVANGTTVKLPSWLGVTLESYSFLLNPDQPYYTLVTVRASSSAPLGTHIVVLEEVVGGEAFTSYLAVTVSQPVYL